MDNFTLKEIPYEGKTKRVEVYARNGNVIGRIQWHGPWRQYVFAPAFPTIFDDDCLRDLSDILEKMTKLHLNS